MMTALTRMVFARRRLLLTAGLAAAVGMSGAAYASAQAGGPAQATTCNKASGQLHVRGVRVYDASGRQFTSYGVSLSGLAGPGYASTVKSEVNKINASATFWCANTVRLQIDQDLLVTGTAKNRQAFWSAIQTEVKAAEQDGLVVALNAQTESDGHEPAPTQNTIMFWQKIATKYGDDPKVIFDLFNEPRAISSTCGTKADWNLWKNGGPYQHKSYLGEQALVHWVRGTAKLKNLIWVENICGSFTNMTRFNDLLTGIDVVYSIHHPWGTPHTAATWDADYGFLIEKNIAPVVDGEWTNYSSKGGECWTDAPTAVPRYLAWLTQHGIGLSGWTLVNGFLIESSNPDDPTVFHTAKKKWACANGLDLGAGAALMAWFNKQNKT